MTSISALNHLGGGHGQRDSSATPCPRCAREPLPQPKAHRGAFDTSVAALPFPASTPRSTNPSTTFSSDALQSLYTDIPDFQHEAEDLYLDFDTDSFCENFNTSPTLLSTSRLEHTRTQSLEHLLQKSYASSISPMERVSTRRSCNRESLCGGNGCLNSALRILRTLHLPSASCVQVSRHKQQPRAIDNLFNMGRSAIHTWLEIVNCSCIGAPDTHLLLFVIAKKLVAWYRAILRSQYSHGEQSAAAQSNMYADMLTSDSEEPLARHIATTPVTVGCYALDISLARQVYAQIVLDELAQLETAVERLISNLEGLSDYHNGIIESSGFQITPPQPREGEVSLPSLQLAMVKQSIQEVKEEAGRVVLPVK
ncbi:hypothetical protein EJ08DRAFT_30858 [Tothia fuscella]|uniref:Aflatoxin regulatory protein domain-containing protein n=1 Tax=Tothia fuscella TaxID=1048955 RepID=A0A9P4TSH4_9PEZI|nr:hypothetical protein EJ08DRAFT_30858 [Tothia fuscella]